MAEKKIPPALVMAGGLGLGLAVAVGVYALTRAARVGFTLSIVNPPPDSTHWTAEFYSEEEGAFIYPPEPLAISEAWDCAFNPYGTTSLRIRVLDRVNAITLLDVQNIGPINSGISYIYDCAAGGGL